MAPDSAQTRGVRTFGVEEELLLVDDATGVPVAAAGRVLRHRDGASRDDSDLVELTVELQQEMLEIVYSPHTDFGSLRDELIQGRLLADAEARAVGARAVALGTSPLRATTHATMKPRYRSIHERYGITARDAMTCGFHVHVSIDSPEEGVGVLDRIRPWLPVLLALSANSPFCNGEDTGYSSYRYNLWGRWPCTGPNEVFGSAHEYRRFEAELLATGALLDEGMLYFDARLSRNHPTVEVRIADVCLLAEDAAVLAALTRGLVETAAREWVQGVPPASVTSKALRLTSWQAALCGLSGTLADPVTGRTAPADFVVERLLDHVQDALLDAGDADAVACGIQRILSSGSGADWQRAEYHRMGSLADVVRAAAAITSGVPVA
jgi:glutamate---cysteine ligase / carboxylate-amine ligase